MVSMRSQLAWCVKLMGCYGFACCCHTRRVPRHPSRDDSGGETRHRDARVKQRRGWFSDERVVPQTHTKMLT